MGIRPFANFKYGPKCGEHSFLSRRRLRELVRMRLECGHRRTVHSVLLFVYFANLTFTSLGTVACGGVRASSSNNA